MEIPQRQKREKETREIVEIIMTENFLKLILNTKLHPGSSENSKKDNTKKLKKNPHLHLGISFSNYRKWLQRKFLEKKTREKYFIYRRTKVRIISNFSDIMPATRKWSEINLLRKTYQPRILYPVLSFKSEGERDAFRKIKIKGVCC